MKVKIVMYIETVLKENPLNLFLAALFYVKIDMIERSDMMLAATL